MRPIDADRIKENLKNHYMPTDQEYEADRQWAVGYNAGIDRALYSLAYAPTINSDDLRPQGRWEFIVPKPEMIGYFQCSQCAFCNGIRKSN